MRYLVVILAAILTVSAASSGEAAPAFELTSFSGARTRLADYRGKVVLLNFWATWCGPCRVEMPWLAGLYGQYRARGLEIVGISMDDEGSDEAVVKFVKERNVSYPILKGTAEVADAYGGARLLPQTFVISRDGRILNRMSGLRKREEFENLIKRALAKE